MESLRVEEGEDASEGVVRGDAVGEFEQTRKPLVLGVAVDLDLDPIVGPADDGAEGEGDAVPE